MQKLKSEELTQAILEILAEVQELKIAYKEFEHFGTLKTHLSSAEKILHELTLKIKNKDVGIK